MTLSLFIKRKEVYPFDAFFHRQEDYCYFLDGRVCQFRKSLDGRVCHFRLLLVFLMEDYCYFSLIFTHNCYFLIHFEKNTLKNTKEYLPIKSFRRLIVIFLNVSPCQVSKQPNFFQRKMNKQNESEKFGPQRRARLRARTHKYEREREREREREISHLDFSWSIET